MLHRSRALASALAVVLSLASAARAQDPDGLPLPATKKPVRASLPATIDTGFDPAQDGASFVNIGTYASQGDCLGMSLTAIDRFLRRRSGETLPAQEPPDTKNAPRGGLVGDPVDHETAAVVQAVGNRDEAVFDHAKKARFSDPGPVNAALERIAATGKPEVLGLDGKHDGHAIVLFGYKDGKLQIYDPNYPGETIQWPFDPVHGLKKYPKALGTDPKEADMRRFYGGITTVTPVPFDHFQVSRDIAKIRGECSAQAKACAAKFPTVTTNVTPSRDGKSVTITGTVTRGLTKGEDGPTERPALVILRVNGVLGHKPVPLRGGHFTVTLPASALQDGDNVVQVVATTDGGGFAGFATTKPFQIGGVRKGVNEALGAVGR